jgi:hypothetical protein
VNIAARVQSLAEGGQIVCSEEVWNAPGVQRIIEVRSLASRREVASLKGIATRFPVRRIVVAGAAETRPARSAAKKRPEPAGAGGKAPPRKAALRKAPAAKTAVRKPAAKRKKAG